MSTAPLALDLIAVLAQGEQFLLSLGDDCYFAELSAGHAPIGSHYRHVLEHARLWLDARGQSEIDYEQRRRDPLLEQNRSAAIAATQELIAATQEVDLATLRQPLRMKTQASYAATEPSAAESSFGRELIFVIAHTVHHYAIISLIGHRADLSFPPHFGLAPSTFQHRLQS